MKSRKKYLRHSPRRPGFRYFIATTDKPNYYMIAWTNLGHPHNPPTSVRSARTIYHADSVPMWMYNGMAMLDVAASGRWGATHIEGFGSIYIATVTTREYCFYEATANPSEPMDYSGKYYLKAP